MAGAEREGALELAERRLLIGGEWREAVAGATFAVEDPATGRDLCRVADASAADASAALDAAVAAQAGWAAAAPRERGEVLRRAFELTVARAEELALLMTLEMGKALAESRSELAYAADYLRWSSEEATRIAGRFWTAPGGDARMLTMREPVGPCLLITPWNFPAAMATRKLGPALAAGCTAIVKPAEQAPLTMLALARILGQAGLPDGVLGVLTTASPAAVGSTLLADPRLRKLSFTGSTEVGRKLLAAAAPNVLRSSMELGGNAPFIVFEDADLELAVEAAVVAKMRNAGEACTAANRFHVAAPVAEEFGLRLSRRMAALKVGPGTDDSVDVGPLVDAGAREKVQELVDDATARGARCLTGGSPDAGPGYFYPPTVLAGVDRAARLLREEVFGPVAPVAPFATEEEAVALANDTEYGLVAFVCSRDLGRALRVAERLEVGMVGLNRGVVSDVSAPFGGVKHSGIGREGGREGIDEYLETKYVAIAAHELGRADVG